MDEKQMFTFVMGDKFHTNILTKIHNYKFVADHLIGSTNMGVGKFKFKYCYNDHPVIWAQVLYAYKLVTNCGFDKVLKCLL